MRQTPKPQEPTAKSTENQGNAPQNFTPRPKNILQHQQENNSYFTGLASIHLVPDAIKRLLIKELYATLTPNSGEASEETTTRDLGSPYSTDGEQEALKRVKQRPTVESANTPSTTTVNTLGAVDPPQAPLTTSTPSANTDTVTDPVAPTQETNLQYPPAFSPCPKPSNTADRNACMDTLISKWPEIAQLPEITPIIVERTINSIRGIAPWESNNSHPLCKDLRQAAITVVQCFATVGSHKGVKELLATPQPTPIAPAPYVADTTPTTRRTASPPASNTSSPSPPSSPRTPLSTSDLNSTRSYNTGHEYFDDDMERAWESHDKRLQQRVDNLRPNITSCNPLSNNNNNNEYHNSPPVLTPLTGRATGDRRMELSGRVKMVITLEQQRQLLKSAPTEFADERRAILTLEKVRAEADIDDLLQEFGGFDSFDPHSSYLNRRSGKAYAAFEDITEFIRAIEGIYRIGQVVWFEGYNPWALQGTFYKIFLSSKQTRECTPKEIYDAVQEEYGHRPSSITYTPDKNCVSIYFEVAFPWRCMFNSRKLAVDTGEKKVYLLVVRAFSATSDPTWTKLFIKGIATRSSAGILDYLGREGFDSSSIIAAVCRDQDTGRTTSYGYLFVKSQELVEQLCRGINNSTPNYPNTQTLGWLTQYSHFQTGGLKWKNLDVIIEPAAAKKKAVALIR